VEISRSSSHHDHLYSTSTTTVSQLHLTALLRLAELISKDPLKRREAESLHERILSLKSDYGVVYESYGNMMRSMNRHEEAAVMLAKALEYHPQDPDALYNVSHE